MPDAYRIRNWSTYSRALVRRGDVTVWLSGDALVAWRYRGPTQPGGRVVYSDLAIEACLCLRTVYGLALRQTQGFVGSLLGVMDAELPVPDYSTLSRRAAGLDVALSCTAGRHDGDEPRHIVIDSTGLKVYGEGDGNGGRTGPPSVVRGESCTSPSIRTPARSRQPS